jgi:hypothetical protein
MFRSMPQTGKAARSLNTPELRRRIATNQGAGIMSQLHRPVYPPNLVPIIQGPRSCVIVKLSDQKVDPNKIFTESLQKPYFRLLKDCSFARPQNRSIAGLEPFESTSIGQEMKKHVVKQP